MTCYPSLPHRSVAKVKFKRYKKCRGNQKYAVSSKYVCTGMQSSFEVAELVGV